jgi:NADH-quinone oxidoreductase E subunit
MEINNKDIIEIQTIEFSESEIIEIERIKSRYPDTRSILMAVLWMAQNKFGWISEDVKNYISLLLNIPYSLVHGVASFYTMYYKKKPGKYHIQVCTNVSCMLCGGEEIYRHISDILGIKHNETSNDSIFSLEEVECMGACGGAPMIAVNEDYFENMNLIKVDEIIERLKD